MSPTVEEKPERIYCIRLKSADAEIRVSAGTICKPSEGDNTYRLKREGNVVGEFEADEVIGWWVDVRRLGDG